MVQSRIGGLVGSSHLLGWLCFQPSKTRCDLVGLLVGLVNYNPDWATFLMLWNNIILITSWKKKEERDEWIHKGGNSALLLNSKSFPVSQIHEGTLIGLQTPSMSSTLDHWSCWLCLSLRLLSSHSHEATHKTNVVSARNHRCTSSSMHSLEPQLPLIMLSLVWCFSLFSCSS